MMNCEKFLALLAQSIETRSPVSSAVQEHGQHCPQQECRSQWREFVLLENALAAWKSSIPSVDFVHRVTSELSVHKPVQPSRPQVEILPIQATSTHRFRLLASVASLCGVVAMLLALATGLQPLGKDDLARNVPASAPETEVNSPRQFVAVPPEQEALVAISSQCVGWVEGATHRVTDLVTYVIYPENSPMDQIPPQEVPRNWFRNWEERLQPLENSLDRTLRELLREQGPSAGSSGDRTS
jgi:hypothetical protein